MSVVQEEGCRPAELPPGDVTFLSLNRFERKKNVALAIRALAAAGTNARLVVAGGWDSRLVTFQTELCIVFQLFLPPRVKENVEHCGELMQLAEELGIGSRVVFLRSISDREKV